MKEKPVIALRRCDRCATVFAFERGTHLHTWHSKKCRAIIGFGVNADTLGIEPNECGGKLRAVKL